jgi:predicted extracellular nuclease
MIPSSSPLRFGWLVLLLLLVVLAVWSSATPVTASPMAAISLGNPYSQNFNSLPTTSITSESFTWTDDSTLVGWYSNRITIIADAGGANTGGLHSYGATSSSERAFGSLGSTSANPVNRAIRFINDTAIPVTSLTITYTGEQWRTGGTGAVNNTLFFAYQVGTGLTNTTTGTWTAVNTLDFESIIDIGTGGALDGNASANRQVVGPIVVPVTVNPGQEIMLRWSDPDNASGDHGLAIDDLSVTSNLTTATATPTTGGSPTPTLTPTTSPSCGTPTTFIHEVQGSGAASPLTGQVVTIEGVVTARFTGLNGFYVQEEESDIDANPLTSEGIFVFDPSASPSVVPGEVVRVTGRVDEFFTTTEIDTVSAVLPCGAEPLPAPVSLALPVSNYSLYEAYEGMYVTVSDGGGGSLTVSQNFFQGRYGQLTISADGRMFHPNNGNGDTADYNARRKIILDDGTSAQNPNPIPYINRTGTPPQDYTLRAGDTINNITGVIDYGLIDSGGVVRDYKIQPTGTITSTRVNQRTSAPDPVGGSLKIASFNVLNYFNGNGMGGGFPTLRGADNLAEFTRQRNKIIPALVALNADVVGLMEIENDNDDPILNNRAIQNLVDGLNGVLGSNTYAYALEPSPGDDEIKVAMLYKPAVVQPLNVLNYQTTHPDYGNLFDRPPLAVLFEYNLTGERFVVVVNHFKSKSSCPTSGPDIEQGDGQGCWNVKRVAQATALAAWIQNTIIPTYDADVLIVGDLNAYGVEDPIDALTASGFINEVAAWVPAVQRYSYIFDGTAGYLDHAISTPGFSDQVTGATIWHINTDEPSVIDYNTEFKPEDLYAPIPYRSSDHDPVLVGVSLRAADYSDSPASYGVAWHSAPHSVYLGAGVTDDDTAGENDDNPTDDGVAVIQNRVEVMVSGTSGAQGWLSGWVDLNNDGVFATPDEQIVNQLVTVGSNTIPLSTVLPTSSLRFRFRLYESTTEPLALMVATPGGGETGGEVEDFTATPLAVVLAEFTAYPVVEGIEVRWETVSEVGTLGYNLWRSTSPINPTDQLNSELIPAQSPGGGGALYTWLDETVSEGDTYYYWLESVEGDGSTALYGPVSATTLPPTAVTLGMLTVASSTIPTIPMIALLVIGMVMLWVGKKRYV